MIDAYNDDEHRLAVPDELDRDRRGLLLHTKDSSGQWIKASESVWQGIWARRAAFAKRHDQPLQQWISERHHTHGADRFAPETLNVHALETAQLQAQLSDQQIAASLALSLEQWLTYKSTKTLPVRLFRPLRDTFGLPSENELLGEAAPTVRMPLPRHEDIAMCLTRFDHIEVSSDTAHPALAQELGRLCAQPFKTRRKWGRSEVPGLKSLSQKLRSAGIVVCAMCEKQFISDLPLGYSRYGLVMVLTFATEEEVSTQNGQIDPANVASLPSEEKIGSITPEWLREFNAPVFTGEDLLRYSEMVEEMRNPDGDDADRFPVTLFAATRVFRSEPEKAHSANVRMEAVSRLLQLHSLEPWVLPSADTDAKMLSRPIFEAAARCTLIDVSGRAGFDIHEFKRLVVEHVRHWEH